MRTPNGARSTAKPINGDGLFIAPKQSALSSSIPTHLDQPICNSRLGHFFNAPVISDAHAPNLFAGRREPERRTISFDLPALSLHQYHRWRVVVAVVLAVNRDVINLTDYIAVMSIHHVASYLA